MPTTPNLKTIRHQIVDRLEAANLSPNRFVSLCEGQKRPDQKWRDTDLLPGDVSGNYGVKCGDGLVVLDIDDHKPGIEPPTELEVLPSTFSTESCHGGTHLWYRVNDGEIENAGAEWGDIQSEGSYIVGPGSEVHGTRGGKDCSYTDCCTEADPGVYQVSNARPIEEISADQLTVVPGVRTDTERNSATTDDSTTEWVTTPSQEDLPGIPDNFEADNVENAFGLSLRDVRKVSYCLDRLLDPNERLNPENRYESISEADMHTAYILRGWRFESADIDTLLRACRDREGRDPQNPYKMRRDDYAARTAVTAEQRVTKQIDPAFAWALVQSARENNGHGPKASRDTLKTVYQAVLEAFLWTGTQESTTTKIANTPLVGNDWAVPSTAWTDCTDEARKRRVRRALHILADAGVVDRRRHNDGHYSWSATLDKHIADLLFQVETPDDAKKVSAFGTTTSTATP